MNRIAELLLGSYQSAQQLPFVLLGLLFLFLLLTAYIRRVYPSQMLVGLLLVPSALTLLLLLKADLVVLVLTADFALFLIAIWDIFRFPKPSTLNVERKCQRIASLQKGHPVQITVTNHSEKLQKIELRDDIPQEFTADPDRFVSELKPRSRAVFRFDLKPSRRGAFTLRQVYVRLQSRLGLWHAYRNYPTENVINVYPDMQQLSKYALLARTNRLSLMGVRRTRRIGQDHEFERLRDYTPDDNYKHIDWRSTARRNKLTVKDFQTSQSQRLIFLIDCGRMMTNQSAGISLLDHALNAMLMLSYVALRQGDSVGMLGFSDQIHTFVPPTGGLNQMNRLLHASFDRFPHLVESRYDQAFLHLGAHCQKRSFVILVTNVIDEVNAHQIQRYMGSLTGRHLSLGVLIRDHSLFDAVDNVGSHGTGLRGAPYDGGSFKAGSQPSDIYRSAAAAGILAWRKQVLRDLEHQGVMALDVFPEDMTAPLVNKYLEVKARHLL